MIDRWLLTPLARLRAVPGRWLCNLGFHRAERNGSMMGEQESFEIGGGKTIKLSYLKCQRPGCGVMYPGSVKVKTWETFP